MRRTLDDSPEKTLATRNDVTDAFLHVGGQVLAFNFLGKSLQKGRAREKGEKRVNREDRPM
jgi:hypothetical protein